MLLLNALQYNVALPPAILSRFDLVYVMIDDPDEQTDYHIAHHIVRVHQKREEALSPAFTTAQIKRYISYAKTLKPKVFPPYYLRFILIVILEITFILNQLLSLLFLHISCYFSTFLHNLYQNLFFSSHF